MEFNLGKTSKKILVADGHEASRHVISIMLHKLGYKDVFEAGDWNQANKIINDNVKTNTGMTGLLGSAAPQELCEIDLCIMDSELGEKNGLDCLTEIRKRFDHKLLPVVFTCMKTSDCNLGDASNAGANDTLKKPFPLEEFKTKLDNLLKKDGAPVIKSFAFAGGGEAKQATKKPEKKPEPVKVASEPAAVKVSSKPADKVVNGGNKKKGTGGVSFYGASKADTYSTDGEPTATLVDGKIDGHYHEEVNVIGGGQNCYWATQIEGEERVLLEYLSPKGRRTSMEAKKISVEQFMYTFYLCDEHSCAILEREAGS